jgi:hypothetical protein
LKVLAVLELPLTQEQDGYEKKIDRIVAVREEDRAKQQAADEAQAAQIAAERTQQYGNTLLWTGDLGMGKEAQKVQPTGYSCCYNGSTSATPRL